LRLERFTPKKFFSRKFSSFLFFLLTLKTNKKTKKIFFLKKFFSWCPPNLWGLSIEFENLANSGKIDTLGSPAFEQKKSPLKWILKE